MRIRRHCALAFVLGGLFFSVVAGADNALLLTPPEEGGWQEAANTLAEAAQRAGYNVARLGFDGILDHTRLDTARAPLLLLPDASALPADALEPLAAYIEAGGDLVALNTPLARTLLLRDGEAWVTREDYALRHADDLLANVLLDFPGENPLQGWSRSSNDMTTPTVHQVVSTPDQPVQKALHVTIPKLNNWDTFRSPAFDRPFPEDHTLTVFQAKGGPDTSELLIEWGERDGSRWLATVPLSTAWRQYVLQPADFKFWESVPARKGTQFNPQNAHYFTVGLALSHTATRGERQEYWIGNIGTAPRTPEHEKLLTSYQVPALDTLCPAYKFYPVRDVATAFVRGGHAFLDAGRGPLPGSFQCIHPRPQAGGFDKGRDWRWQPLLEAESDGGDWRGAFATLFVNAGGEYAGSVWASFAVDDPAWYCQEAVRDVLENVCAKMRDGLYLVDGGTDHYTYFDAQPIEAGATLVNCASESRTVDVAMRLEERNDVLETVIGCTIDPGAVKRVAEPLASERKSGAMTVELRDGDTVIDRAVHEIHPWRPDAETPRITVENGDFMLAGERWRPHGVNYMPSSGIAVEDQSYFEYWIGARSYDPEIIARDLRRVKAMDMNAISVFIYHRSMEAQNLLDLLRLCDELGLYVNLSLRPGTPLDFEWEKIRELITYYRLAEQHRVFALDLAWEPMFGNHEDRKQWDPHWRDWVTARYGSFENALEDWAFEPPRDAQDRLTNPLGKMTTTDGPWRVYVAAYRRFLDTLLYQYYRAAYDKVRALDPHHLISFRMTEAGNPTFNWAERIPYDYPYLAAAVDLLEPEAYGRIGDWEKVKPGWFQFEYGRWAAPALPFMWAEAGVHVWSKGAGGPTRDLLDFQAAYYEHLYRMFISSGADGIFFWWYPGGYRVNERSDYGIINPDGTDRPVTNVIRAQAEKLINGPDARDITTWFTIDRDKHPAGVNGIYTTHEADFWAAIAQDEAPGLRTEATGTDSANCPLTAVGNVPGDGDNPPKYLDGFFDKVEVKNAKGEWVAVESGGEVAVAAGTEVQARVTIVNLAEAAWSVADGPGQVAVVAASEAGDVKTPLPHGLARHERLRDMTIAMPPMNNDAFDVVLRFNADMRTMFGPLFTLRILPA